MRGQNAMDTLNVRIARWVTKVPWHGGNSGQNAVAHRQTDLFPGNPRVLFVKTVKRLLFPSTNQNYNRTIQPKFPVQNQIYGQPVVLFPRNLEIKGIFRSIGHTLTVASHAVVFRGGGNSSPLKTTAWEANPD